MKGFALRRRRWRLCWPASPAFAQTPARAAAARRSPARPGPQARRPAPAGARAPTPPAPRPAAVPGGRQDRVRRAAADRQRVGRRQGGHGEIQALQQKKANELNDKNKQLAEHPAEARKGRLGDERDRAGRSAEAGREAQRRDPALHAGRAAGDSGAAEAAAAAVPAAHRADPRSRSARRRACTSSSTVPTRAWSGPTPASTSRPTSSRSSTRHKPARRRSRRCSSQSQPVASRGAAAVALRAAPA